MGKKKKAKRAMPDYIPPMVTFRQITVDLEGGRFKIDAGGWITPRAKFVTIPILSGDAVFVSEGPERVA
jgi:hypothetical protein